MIATLRRVFARFANVLHPASADRDVEREIASHVALLEDEHRRRGLSPEEARRAARLDLGGVEQTKELHRNARSWPWLDDARHDIRHALQIYLRNPGFTLVATVTLALGIGANVAIFSVVRAVLLTELPYANPDRLVVMGQGRIPDGTLQNVGFTTLLDWRERLSTVSELAAIRSWNPTLRGDGLPERLRGMRVTSNYFGMLGIQPALGRDFTTENDLPDRSYVVLLSHGLWQRRFGGDPGVVGRSLRLSDREYTVVGVMPSTLEPLISAHFYKPAELWAPVGYATSDAFACRTCQHLKAVGRLAPGVSVDQARDEVESVQGELRKEHPNEYAPAAMEVVRLDRELRRNAWPVLLALSAAVVLILLVACANIANLLVARATIRQREMAMRATLGAGRGRLVRQLLTESLVLAVAGGTSGLFLAAAGLRTLVSAAPGAIHRLHEAAIDGPVLVFTIAVALATALLVGVLPAFRASRTNLQPTLEADSRGIIGPRFRSFRSALVVFELALTLVLLAGSGLMLKTVARLSRVDPGFDPANVLTFQTSMVGTAYAEDRQILAATDLILDRIRALPGVESAAAVNQVPLSGDMDMWGFHVQGHVLNTPAEAPSVERYSVTPDYFQVMKIPVLRGRTFTAYDRADGPSVILVGETTAREQWPGQDPVGQRVRVPVADSGPWRTVVGVVGDVRHYDVATAPTMQMYMPASQEPAAYSTFAIRTKHDPASLAGAVRAALGTVSHDLPMYEVATMTERVASSTARQQFVTRLLGLFAGTALLLAAVGLYGVVASLVAQRTHEVGLRVALGADAWDIVKLVASNGARLLSLGLIIGLFGSVGLSRLLRGMLYNVAPGDPAVLGAVAAILAVIAVVAHVVPLRRALRIDPAAALRAL